MLEWLTNELMKLEAENKVGAHQGEHCPTRTPINSAATSNPQEAAAATRIAPIKCGKI